MTKNRCWAIPLVVLALLMAAWPNLVGALIAAVCAAFVWRRA